MSSSDVAGTSDQSCWNPYLIQWQKDLQNTLPSPNWSIFEVVRMIVRRRRGHWIGASATTQIHVESEIAKAVNQLAYPTELKDM